jgi:argininosuccinate lyase
MVWPGLAEAGRALALARIAAETAAPNAELLLARARANYSTATDLADLLVRRGGMDFRTAHHVAGAVVRALMDRGLGADRATAAIVDEAAMLVAGRAAGLAEAEVTDALDPARSVAARNVRGGPSPAEVRRMAAEMREQLRDDEARVASWRSGMRAAAAQRRAEVESLARATDG